VKRDFPKITLITKEDVMENHEIEGISNYLKPDALPMLKFDFFF
jgi:hypothetical protein